MNDLSLPRVFIVGGGFAGLSAAKALAKAPVAVTVLDRRNHHVFQPLLYQVATASLSPADISAPIRTALRKQRNCQVALSTVDAVDVERRRLILDGDSVSYDWLVLAGDVVAKKKPNPEIYVLARERLALSGQDCVVIEDSRNGLLASLGAGMPTLITTSTYTTTEDFKGAAKVVPELGDPPKVLVTLEDLKAIGAQRAA